MEVSKHIQDAIPEGLKIVGDPRFFIITDITQLPCGSRVPTDYSWLSLNDPPRESYIIQVGGIIHKPGGNSILIAPISSSASNPQTICWIAYWRDNLWGFSAPSGMDTQLAEAISTLSLANENPLSGNRWPLGVFENVLEPEDFEVVQRQPQGSTWIQIARKA